MSCNGAIHSDLDDMKAGPEKAARFRALNLKRAVHERFNSAKEKKR